MTMTMTKADLEIITELLSLLEKATKEQLAKRLTQKEWDEAFGTLISIDMTRDTIRKNNERAAFEFLRTFPAPPPFEKIKKEPSQKPFKPSDFSIKE